MNTPLTLGKIITLVLSLKDPLYRKYLNRLNHPERSHTLENNKTNGRDLLSPLVVFRCPCFLNQGIELKDCADRQRSPRSTCSPPREHPATARRAHFPLQGCPRLMTRAPQQPADFPGHPKKEVTALGSTSKGQVPALCCCGCLQSLHRALGQVGIPSTRLQRGQSRSPLGQANLGNLGSLR